MEENGLLVPSFKELISRLTPELEQIEAKRIELLNLCAKKGLITAAISIVLGIGFMWYLGGDILVGVGIAFIISVIGFIIFASSGSRIICEEYKKTIVMSFVRNLIENGQYNPYSGISRQLFNGCNLFNSPDRYHSEDLISGLIGKTSIEFSEVHAEEKYQTTDSKGRTQTHWRDIFKGFIFVGDFHKDFSGRTEICRNSWLKFRSNRVKMEDPVFEKCFDVYSTDQIEARYILSVSMMERILELEKKFHKRDMVISFWNSNVIIAIRDTTNHFEASIWSSIKNQKKLEREYNIIKNFADIVEDLNLNLRIWTKE